MCIGIPMQVIETDGATALCEDAQGHRERIDIALIGEVAEGAWLMTFLGAAREVMDETSAQRASDALKALGMALRGEAGFEHLFADLIDREPQLPEHLRDQNKTKA
ncbi:MAG: HypC/HybG/HupF family hydrogenase formation chaperone [Tepidamorphaceae bacterium]|nr:HypC/HybG/HupF family hydrogenase formation chaperone [Rhodobiaceae bacterium]